MKLKYLTVIAGLLCISAAPSSAQTLSVTAASAAEALELAGLSLNLASNNLVHVGVPFTLSTGSGSQTYLLTTNNNGYYTISTSGALGTNSFTPPANYGQAIAQAQAWIAANNTNNIGYYATNEIDVKIGLQYVQNSGQAVASLAIEKYGLFGWGNGNVGIGAGILEGNNGSSQGTAAEYAEVLYRKPIGDVAFFGGIVGGYDDWHAEGFAGGKLGLEYRQSPHLGEFLEVTAVYENGTGSSKPAMVGGGFSGSF